MIERETFPVKFRKTLFNMIWKKRVLQRYYQTIGLSIQRSISCHDYVKHWQQTNLNLVYWICQASIKLEDSLDIQGCLAVAGDAGQGSHNYHSGHHGLL